MSNLIYLVIAVALSLFGSLFLYLRNRQPRSMEARMQEFAKGLRAIAPDGPRREQRRSG